MNERRIAVGVDGSPGSVHALRWAAKEASLHGADLELVHAWEAPAPISGVGFMLSPREAKPYELAAQRVLDEATGTALRSVEPGVRIFPILTHGYAPAQLLEEARDSQLVAVGTRGLSGLRCLVVGSTSHHCTLHSTVPVAVVPTTASWAALEEVVVGIDGSPDSACALRWALREAVTREAKLMVVNAWRFDSRTAPADYRYAAANRTTFREQSEELLRREIQAAIEAVGTTPIRVDSVASDQPPVQALVDRAGVSRLLVVGRRGTGGFAGLRLGSVSQHCLHHSRGVVVVVPPTEKEVES
jgi:nucleotide-binding universal stress UspA family protein